MGTETDPTKLGAIASRIKDVSGVDLSTGPVSNPAGLEVAGQNLTIPKSTPLSELASGTQPEQGFIKPFVPKDASIQAALINKEATLAAHKEDTQAKLEQTKMLAGQSDETKRWIASQSDDTKRWIGGIMQQNHQDSIEQRRSDAAARLEETANRNTLVNKYLTGKAESEQENKIHTILGKLNKEYEEIPIKNESAKVAAANQFNGAYERYKKTHPDVVADYSRLEPITPEGYIYNTGNQGKPLRGLKPAGETPTQQVPKDETSQYQLPDKSTGKLVPVTKEIYDAYQKKYGLTQ
jgi:predicted metal-dependent hydrolase